MYSLSFGVGEDFAGLPLVIALEARGNAVDRHPETGGGERIEEGAGEIEGADEEIAGGNGLAESGSEIAGALCHEAQGRSGASLGFHARGVLVGLRIVAAQQETGVAARPEVAGGAVGVLFKPSEIVRIGRIEGVLFETEELGKIGRGDETHRVAALPLPILRGHFVSDAAALAKIGSVAVETAKGGAVAERKGRREGAQQRGVGIGGKGEDYIGVVGGHLAHRGGRCAEQSRGGRRFEVNTHDVGLNAGQFVLETSNEKGQYEEENGEKTEGGHERKRKNGRGCDAVRHTSRKGE